MGIQRKIVWSSGPEHDEVSITATMKTRAEIQDIREALQIICDTFPEDKPHDRPWPVAGG